MSVRIPTPAVAVAPILIRERDGRVVVPQMKVVAGRGGVARQLDLSRPALGRRPGGAHQTVYPVKPRLGGGLQTMKVVCASALRPMVSTTFAVTRYVAPGCSLEPGMES